MDSPDNSLTRCRVRVVYEIDSNGKVTDDVHHALGSTLRGIGTCNYGTIEIENYPNPVTVTELTVKNTRAPFSRLLSIHPQSHLGDIRFDLPNPSCPFGPSTDLQMNNLGFQDSWCKVCYHRHVSV